LSFSDGTFFHHRATEITEVTERMEKKEEKEGIKVACHLRGIQVRMSKKIC
jgi:hypothetical protein